MMPVVNRKILLGCPFCVATIHGAESYLELSGTVSFYRAVSGSLVVAELFYLPSAHGVFAMHIHQGSVCTGTPEEPFADAGTHFDLGAEMHPFHSGDLPAVFSNDGYAWSAVYTNRFYPAQVIGRTVIIHAMPDDFHTQPSGNAGGRIACGVIRSCCNCNSQR